jgi:probable phosphoglycerate mutase
VTRLLLIRHGRSTWNAIKRIQGQADPLLDEVGREQARRLAERLRDNAPVVLYTSSLRRAQETAEIIGETPGVEVTSDERLKEYDVGDITGLTWEQIAEVGER